MTLTASPGYPADKGLDKGVRVGGGTSLHAPHTDHCRTVCQRTHEDGFYAGTGKYRKLNGRIVIKAPQDSGNDLLSVGMNWRMIRSPSQAESGSSTLCARDQLDDGSPIVLQVSLDQDKGTAVFDFTGSSPQVIVSSVFNSFLLLFSCFSVTVICTTSIPSGSGDR